MVCVLFKFFNLIMLSLLAKRRDEQCRGVNLCMIYFAIAPNLLNFATYYNRCSMHYPDERNEL